MKKLQIKRVIVLALTTMLVISGVGVSTCFSIVAEENAKGKIYVSLIYEETPLEGVELNLFRVANLDVDGNYILVGDFSQMSASFNSASAEENRDQADTVFDFTQEAGVDPFQTQITDQRGSAVFTELPDGKYLLSQGKTPYDLYLFMHALIDIPYYNDGDDTPVYEIDADPKIELGPRAPIEPWEPEPDDPETKDSTPPAYNPNDPNDPNNPYNPNNPNNPDNPDNPDNPNNPNNPKTPYNPNVPSPPTPFKLFGRIPFTGIILGIAPVLISFVVLIILFFLRKKKKNK
ncbi:MAG: SpaA isopeptide-forming pilin-related protein [Oscillospiraceae bacterium]|nr:SpaA isopeptide-forming pilin-related protein [Oscillospiraceae bacterium]